MTTSFVASIPIWGVFLGTLLLVLLSIDLGYRAGSYKQSRSELEREKEAPVGAMVGSTLALLAFLLAVTFSIAESGFQQRKGAVLAEANAVRTSYLETAFLSEPERNNARQLLREYTDARLQWSSVSGATADESSRNILNRLWREAASAGIKDPTSNTAALFISSITDLIRVHDERTELRTNSRIPEAFQAVLLLITVLTFAAMGYHSGVASTPRGPVMVAVAIAYSLVTLLITDLDRPDEGWINVSQQPMLDVRSALKQPSP